MGILLGIFPIVRFFSMGYSYKVFKSTLNGGEPYLPEWEDYGDLFIQGFKITIMILCYFIVPIVLSWTGLIYIMIGIGGMLVEVLDSAEGVEYIFKGGLFYTLGIITKIPPYLLWPMAFANYCRGGEKIRAAFKRWEIIPKIFTVTGDYILSLLLMFSIDIVLIFSHSRLQRRRSPRRHTPQFHIVLLFPLPRLRRPLRFRLLEGLPRLPRLPRSRFAKLNPF